MLLPSALDGILSTGMHNQKSCNGPKPRLLAYKLGLLYPSMHGTPLRPLGAASRPKDRPTHPLVFFCGLLRCSRNLVARSRSTL
jgi:hypothetical protein